jgi:hypothetical protein
MGLRIGHLRAMAGGKEVGVMISGGARPRSNRSPTSNMTFLDSRRNTWSDRGGHESKRYSS